MDTLEFLSQDREARRLYEERQKYLHDEASMIEWATEKGLKKGLEEGLAKGLAKGLEEGLTKGERQKAVEIARNMLSLDIEIEVIAKASGLSESEVQSLKPIQ